MAATSGWYYLDATTGAPAGPVDVVSLQGLLSGGHIQPETHVWCEGQPEWQPLKDVHELKSIVHIALDLLKKKNKTGGEDDLAAFQAEVAAIEALNAVSEDGPGPGDGPSTPDELEFEDDDGTMYVWDKKLRKYMPKGAVQSSEAGYDESDMVYQGDDDHIPSLEAARQQQMAELAAAGGGAEAGPSGKGGLEAGKKRAAEGPAGEGTVEGAAGQAQGAKKGKGGKGGKGQGPQQPEGWFELKNNTSIYIQGLPLDVTVEEVAEACSKFGLIKEDENKKPRIKLYRHKETGELKGDGLVTFLKEPSVALAVNLLDGARLRPADTRCPVMAVQPAKFEQKGDAYQPKAKKPTDKKARKAVLEQQERRLHWGGFDDKAPPDKVTVILTHMFRPLELASELGAAAELETEVMEESKKIGPVDKVRVYKDHPEGVVSVRFKQVEHASACVAKMHGRFFSGQRISAALWDGVTNYAAVKVKETAQEEEARLEAYSRELEAKKAAREAAAAATAADAAQQ